MRVCVVGAGAIGGWMAGVLSGAGCEVCVLARGQTLNRLERDGLHIRRDGIESVFRLKASEDPGALGTQDIVIIAVKGQSIPGLAAVVAAMLGPKSAIVPAVNGIPWWFFQLADVPLSGTSLAAVDPDGCIARALPAERVIGCVVHASAWTPQPGVVEVFAADKLILGESVGGSSKRCRRLAEAFTAGGVAAVESSDIRRDIWNKLWGNMTMNPLSVLTGATTREMLGDAGLRELCLSMMTEMQRLGGRIGIPLAMTPNERMAVTLRLGDFKTSMLRDFEVGRAIELDPILGALVELAGRLDEPVPSLCGVLGLARLRAARGRFAR